MQQAIPYSSGRSAWLPMSRRTNSVAGRGTAIFLDRPSAFEGPLSGSSTTTTTTTTTTTATTTSSSAASGSIGSCGTSSAASAASVARIRSLVSENPVLVLGRRGCCMCHVVKRLLLGLGVNPTVCEVDEDREETAVLEELTGAAPALAQFPAVFIGGRYVGGLDRLMAAHISGDLVPILKDAGALWL